jgi:hypothetical protein
LTLRQHADQAILTTVSTLISSCTAGKSQLPATVGKSAQIPGALSELTAKQSAITIAATEIRNAAGTAIKHVTKTVMAVGSGVQQHPATQTRNV